MSVAELMVERSDAAVISLGLAVWDDYNECLMSVPHDGLVQVAFSRNQLPGVAELPSRHFSEFSYMNSCGTMILPPEINPFHKPPNVGL